MKNILKEYYDFSLEDYKKYNNGIIFFVNGETYYFVPTIFDEDFLRELLNLNEYKIKLHSLIFNNKGTLLSEGYVLMKMNVLIGEINLNDLKAFNLINGEKFKNSYIPMDQFWENKIDYIEKQVEELSAIPVINNSFDYYLGIAEDLLSFLKEGVVKKINLVMAHRSINNLSTIDFYNPLNITFDLSFRDIAAYIRVTESYDLLDRILNNYYEYSSYEYKYLFVRLVFPFEYFHCLEEVLIDKVNISCLIKIIDNNKEYEKYLEKMQNIFGIFIFPWLKKSN